MKRSIYTILVLLVWVFLLLPADGFGVDGHNPDTKIRIRGDGGEAVVALHDNPVSRDLLSLLPLTVTFEDYARTEKITYLPRKLAVAGGLRGDQLEGDFTYYAPWGNLAVFYKGFGKGSGLFIMGRIQSGKEWLAGMSENFTARMEVLENQ